MRAAGIEPPSEIIPDGKIHRFSTNGKKKDDAGWYVLHLDGFFCGNFGDWRTGNQETWCVDIGRGHVGSLSRSYPAQQQQTAQPNTEQERNRKYAWQLWQWAQAAIDTLVQTYLQNRGITCPLSANIRFLPWHKHGPSGKQYPVLLAKIERQPGSGLQAIQRIFLQSDGQGKAPVKPAKMSLGPIKGGAFWIGEPADTLAICEGIEDACSLFVAGYFVAAACGASNMKNLIIPACVGKIIMAADHGEAGEQQAHKAAQTYLRQGHDVRVTFPPAGQDWNDMLQADNREVGI